MSLYNYIDTRNTLTGSLLPHGLMAANDNRIESIGSDMLSNMLQKHLCERAPTTFKIILKAATAIVFGTLTFYAISDVISDINTHYTCNQSKQQEEQKDHPHDPHSTPRSS